MLNTEPDRVVDHAPQQHPCCCLMLFPDLSSEAVSVYEWIELSPVTPFVEHHRCLAVLYPGCGTLVAVVPPAAAIGTPFGPHVHAVAAYLKTFQSLSYERLQATLAGLFGLPIRQGGFQTGRE